MALDHAGRKEEASGLHVESPLSEGLSNIFQENAVAACLFAIPNLK